MPRILEPQSHRIVGGIELERPRRPSVPVTCKFGGFKIVIIIIIMKATATATNSAYYVPSTFLNTFGE